MRTKLKKAMSKISTCIVVLSSLNACTAYQKTYYPPTPVSYDYSEVQYYTQSHGAYDYNLAEDVERRRVNVPASFHVGASASPISAKVRDNTWVNNQNPIGYTILVAEDEQPAVVAKALYQLPKNNRTAEVKRQRFGKTYYQGVYGSYQTKTQALQALETLPDAIKTQAKVEYWQRVQNYE